LLSLATRDHFADPERAYLLYDKVRSAAVHGGDPLEVAEDMHRGFAWDMREALIEYMDLAAREGSKRDELFCATCAVSRDREKLAEWLPERDPES
jgi:hypothetical protein